jgi:hypothetical protein
MFTVTSPLRERRGREVSKSAGDLFPDEIYPTSGVL